MLTSSEKRALKELIIDLGLQAEKIKMKKINFKSKEDSSPLTEADILINQSLNSFSGNQGLSMLFLRRISKLNLMKGLVGSIFG